MTPDQLIAIRLRERGVSPGPWRYDGMLYVFAADGLPVMEVRGAGAEVAGTRPTGTQHCNGAYIAAVRTDVPELRAEVERLRELCASARAPAWQSAQAATLQPHWTAHFMAEVVRHQVVRLPRARDCDYVALTAA